MFFCFLQYTKQEKEKKSYAKNTDELHIKYEDIINIPFYVTIAYLFNPYSILNCVGQTTTVWSNLLLAGFYYSLSRKYHFFTCLCLALETQRNFYPFVLIIPAALLLSENSNNVRSQITQICATFIFVVFGVNAFGYYLMNNSWSFIDATYGFM